MSSPPKIHHPIEGVATSTPDPDLQASTSTLNATPKRKLGGYDFYRSIGSPKWVVAPMVDQSELAWRLLSRSPLPPSQAGPSTIIPATAPSTTSYTRHQGGAHLCYTPMIHAKVFIKAREASRGSDQFNLTSGEEGSHKPLAGIQGGDRPLFVQFCANDPEVLLEAAKKVEGSCDAVDINFGCPQGIAKRGNYGAFLQDDWDLIRSLISTLHKNLSVPVTAKFRIFPSLERTIAYAQMMEAAGAQILTCHGRTREMKGHVTGLADWEIIREVKKAVKIPVFANGNILYAEDIERCLEVTGCDGVMTAEGNLSNPAIFVPPSHPHAYPSIIALADRYLDIVESLKTPTASSAIKSHLFRIFKRVLETDETLRAMIGKCGNKMETGIRSFREAVREVEKKILPELEAAKDFTPPPIDPSTGYRELPIWAAQPYIRGQPVSTEIGGQEDLVEQEINGVAPGSRPASPRPGINTIIPSPCIHSSPKPCGGIAATRCPTLACLLHCRQLRAVEAGYTEEEAERLAKEGSLVGMGCEAHESKAKARNDRLKERRQSRTEGRKMRLKRRKLNKGTVVDDGGGSGDEEAEFVAGGHEGCNRQ